jgi:hypothetical protein
MKKMSWALTFLLLALLLPKVQLFVLLLDSGRCYSSIGYQDLASATLDGFIFFKTKKASMKAI